jgi:hypothetical protein
MATPSFIIRLLLVLLCAGPVSLCAQEFKLFDREIQVHGWLSQGFVYTNDNNWLTMNTSSGSFAMTDMGLNLSTQLTDKLRVGAQGFDRNLGHLGSWRPSLDWAVADYRFSSWLGIRGGKVKTVLGLYNDSQDQDFLHTFALLPQSVYPTDLRDATIAHLGGDTYGSVPLMRDLGKLSYTAFAGDRRDSIHGGYEYLASTYNVNYSSYGGLQDGADLRWNTPLKGLLIGLSRLDEDLNGEATSRLAPGSSAFIAESDHSKKDWTNQFYGQYRGRKFQIDSEYRRFVHDEQFTTSGETLLVAQTDVRGWYVSGTYQVMKRLALGSYYSRYTVNSATEGPYAAFFPAQTDSSLPGNHIYDKVITARVDLKRFWYAKVEGHFMNGFASGSYPEGFYPQVNPHGFKPDTNALVLETGFYF